MRVALSLLYLALPYYLFAAGMLRGEYAIALALVLTVAIGRLLYSEWRRGDWQGITADRATVQPLLWSSVLALIAVVWMGAGGLGHQETDWAKHNAILHDLTMHPWPVAYEARGDDGEEFLTYYLAYYLPAAAVGKLGGLLAAHAALLVWTWMGLVLSAVWLFRLIGRASWWLLPVFLLLSGLDVVGAVLAPLPFSTYNYFEWWAKLAQYSSNLTLLAWVPQHALAGWIATSLILDRVECRSEISDVGLFAVLCCLWSPFVTLGLIPVLAVAVWRTRFRGLLSFSNCVCGPVVALVSLAFFRSVNSDQVPHGWIVENGHLVGQADFVIDFARGIPLLLLFVLLEFGLYVFLLRRLIRNIPAQTFPRAAWTNSWLAMVGITLTLLPAYRIGENNDLVMRASIPALFVLWILLLRALAASSWKVSGWPVRALAACLFIGSLQPLFQLAMHVKHTDPQLQFTTIAPGSADRDDDEYHRERKPPTVSIAEFKNAYYVQYVGQSESLFYRHLARRSSVDPPDRSATKSRTLVAHPDASDEPVRRR